ncbi:MAG: hypothetical protein RL118_681 [Actinomycetota bacterium]
MISIARKALAALTATTLALALSGCAQGTSTNDGLIHVVSATKVWASIAQAIGGDRVAAEPLIDNANQDPHSFEASTRDQLMVNKADLIIVNGGGYDTFLESMAASDGVAGEVINLDALLASGEAGTNEHFWFSTAKVLTAADAIRDELINLEPDSEADFNAAHDEFAADLNLLAEQITAISAAHPGASVLATEPLLDYMLDELAFTDKTPEAFKEAIEEETDAPLAAIAELEKLLKSGDIKLLFVNAQTASAQVDALVKVAQANNVPVVSVSEFQTEADQSYINFKSNVLLDIETALTTGESSAGDFD